MKYKCVLFDFDGTLANSDPALFDTINDTLAIHGHEALNIDTYKQYAGKKMKELYIRYGGDAENAKTMKETHIRVQRKHLHKYKLFPNVSETLKRLKSKGIKLGIVTTANKNKMIELSEILDMREYFDILIAAEDVTNVKPHKEPFQKALEALSAKPEETLMVGDTDADIEGAKGYNIDVVGVTYSTLGERIRQFKPTYVINNFEELVPIIFSTNLI